MHEILATRYQVAYQLWCVRFFHFVYDIVLRCILLDTIGICACFLYWKEWKVIEFVVQFHWCFDVTLDKVSVLAKRLE